MAIRNAKSAISSKRSYRQTWRQIYNIVGERELSEGEPLSLVQDGANQVLDDNSDEEAYVWLDKMIANINRTDNTIDDY